MVTKRSCFLWSIYLFLSCRLLAQGTEEQRKYTIADTVAFRSFIEQSGTAGGFSMHYHSDYTYSDIYLDTPDKWLYAHGFSLRFRRRMNGDSLVGYGLQLKSEMLTAQAARLEIEDNELTVFRVPAKQGWIPLTDVLAVLFAAIDSGNPNPEMPEYRQALADLHTWIRFKSEGLVAPFRQLHREMETRGTPADAMHTLQPVFGGTEQRLRSHIYIDPAATTPELGTTVLLRIPASERPPFFTDRPTCIWTMESSLDDAVFYALTGPNTGKSLHIFEYELENKYPVREAGTPLMNRFEQALQHTFRLQPHLDSKYKTCVELLGP